MTAAQTVRQGVWTIHHFDTLESTNTTALEWLRNQLRSGAPIDHTAFIAATQTAGRGQHGRVWTSVPGGLYLSAVVASHAIHGALVPLHAGAVVADAIEAFCDVDVGLRWPNDIVIAGRKVGGVLCESAALGARAAVVIGMGINLSQDQTALPSTATTLADLGATVPEPRALALEILRRLDPLPTPEQIIERVRARDALLGRTLTMRVGDGDISGTAVGIADDGRLLLQTNGLTQPIISGSITTIDGRLIRPPVSN